MVLTRAEDGLGGAVRLSEALASRIPNAFYLDQVGLMRFNIIPNKIIVIFLLCLSTNIKFYIQR